MLFAASMTITDGIFVGRFVGSDALAAVNIVAPFFMLATGIGLMFGVGVSVVASVHLSRGRVKAANINITQAYSVSLFFTLIASALGLVFDRELAFLFGSSERLLPYVLEYLHRVLPFMAFYMLLQVGMFVIRLDGSPRFAMWCNAIPALVNLVLDYIFIVPLDWGIAGAAWAFDSGVVIGSLMIIIYTTKCSYTLRLYRIKLSRTSIRLTRRSDRLHDAHRKLRVYSLSGRRRCSRFQCGLLLFSFGFHDQQCHCPIGTTHNQLQLRDRRFPEGTLHLPAGSIYSRNLWIARSFCRMVFHRAPHRPLPRTGV